MYFVDVDASVRDYPGDILTMAFSHCFNIMLGLLAGLRSVICLQNKIQCAVLALELLFGTVKHVKEGIGQGLSLAFFFFSFTDTLQNIKGAELLQEQHIYNKVSF